MSPKSIKDLAAALSLSDKALDVKRKQLRMEHGQDAERELLKWLRHTWEEMRDRDSFLRAGALPSDLGSRATNPRAPALGRGRTGMQRPPGKGRRRHLKKVIKPPTAAQIEQAAEQSAYIEYRDSLDAGVVPRAYQTVISMQAHARWTEHQREENAEQETQRDLQRVNAELRELVKRAVKMGIEPTQVIAPIAREIEAQHKDLRNVA